MQQDGSLFDHLVCEQLCLDLFGEDFATQRRAATIMLAQTSGDVELVPQEQILSFETPPRLEQMGDENRERSQRAKLMTRRFYLAPQTPVAARLRKQSCLAESSKAQFEARVE